MKKVFFFLIISVLALSSLAAQESVIDDEDSLFGSSEDDIFFDDTELIEEITEENSASDLDKAFLVSDGVVLSGSWSFSLGSMFIWSEENLIPDNLLNPDNEIFTARAGGVLLLDARPDPDFRFFAKTSIAYPFSESSTRSMGDIIRIQEMFSDFQYKDDLFFRAGKYTVKWGVGYRWSPADIINITAIDPANPDEDREGPLSVKVQYPFSNHNVYFYLLADNPQSVADLAYALKGEFLIGTAELGTGIYYKIDTPPYAMATLTFGAGDFNFYAEAVGSYGTTKRIIDEVPVSAGYPLGLRVQQPEELYFSGLAGLSWAWSDENEWFSLGISAEYFYNGYGYNDPDVLKNPNIPGLIAAEEISLEDLGETGRHYAGASFSWRELFGAPVSLNINWIGNLSDLSGTIMPQISFDIIDLFDLSVSFPINYGNIGDEYSMNGITYGFSCSLSMGGGRF